MGAHGKALIDVASEPCCAPFHRTGVEPAAPMAAMDLVTQLIGLGGAPWCRPGAMPGGR